MDFDKKLEGFLGSLEAINQYKALMKEKDKSDQIRILYKSNVIQDIFNNTKFRKEKSTTDSKRLREIGNNYFKNGNDVKALDLYNQSCVTSTSDEDLALALANRSAVALRLKKLDCALQNVEWALNIGSYPKQMRYKLHERRGKIYIEMKRYSKAIEDFKKASMFTDDAKKKKEFYKISEEIPNDSIKEEVSEIASNGHKIEGLQPHKNYPAFSSAVDIKYESSRGRFGVAKRDIPMGEMILIEKPLISRLKKIEEAFHCNYCLRFLWKAFTLPCLICEDVVYCSLECREKAKSYHRYECGLTDTLEDILKKMRSKSGESDQFYRMNYRSICQRPVEYFRKNYTNFIKSSHELRVNDIFEPESYESFTRLVNNDDGNLKDNFYSQISACFIVRALKEFGYFGKISDREERSRELTDDEKMVGSLCSLFSQILKFNTHSILELISPNESQTHSFSSALYTNLALLNHSCAMNVVKYFREGEVYVIASRLIKKDEEISENYFPNYVHMEKEKRIPWLKEHYKFSCDCQACAKDFPTLTMMQKYPPHNYKCPHCNIRLKPFPLENLQCSKCSESFIAQNLKNNINSIVGAISSSTEEERKPEALIKIGRSLSQLLEEPDPDYYNYFKALNYSLRLWRGNKHF